SWDSDPEKRPQLIEIKKVLENLQKQIELCCEYPYDSIEPEPEENLQISQITKTFDNTHLYSTDYISDVDSTSNFDSKISDLVKEFGELIIEHKLVGSLKTKEAFLKFLNDYENEAPKVFISLQATRHEQKDLFLALSYFHGFGVEKNIKMYLDSLENACAKDIVEFYYYGIGGAEKDTKLALHMLKSAATVGYIPAMYWLGYCYQYGAG
ncbi:7633_t:CDS:2, partial [Acaulospora morrowiae]